MFVLAYRLTESSAGVVEKLTSTQRMAEDLVEAQSAALKSQETILRNGEELKHTLHHSTQGGIKTFSFKSFLTFPPLLSPRMAPPLLFSLFLSSPFLFHAFPSLILSLANPPLISLISLVLLFSRSEGGVCWDEVDSPWAASGLLRDIQPRHLLAELHPVWVPHPRLCPLQLPGLLHCLPPHFHTAHLQCQVGGYNRLCTTACYKTVFHSGCMTTQVSLSGCSVLFRLVLFGLVGLNVYLERIICRAVLDDSNSGYQQMVRQTNLNLWLWGTHIS